MPHTPAPGPSRRLWRTLTSQRTGLVAGLAAAALLAAGSVLMDRLPGPYAGLADDDVRWFFLHPRWAFWWFYALAAALGVWGLSAAACTVDSVAKRARARIVRPSAYGAPIVHLAFVLALAGHLWGGLTATRQQITLGPSPVTLGDATYQATALDQTTYPNGMPRRVDVTLVRRPVPSAARVAPAETIHLAYNEPYVRDAGAFELLLNRAMQVPAAVFTFPGPSSSAHGEAPGGDPPERALERGQTVREAGWTLTLHNVLAGRVAGVSLYADVTLVDPQGERTRTMLPMVPRVAPSGPSAPPARSAPPATDQPTFRGVEGRVAVSASVRRNPSVPLVVLAALLAALGVLLVVLERRRRGHVHAE